MTKDSICKECRWQKRVVYQERGVEGDPLAIEEARSCKQFVAGEMAGDVEVLECSEFVRVQEGDKVPASKPERFHTIEDVGVQKEK